MFVTQSAVSQTISNLEKKLDCLLFQRNPIKLTQAGIRFLNYADLVLGEESTVLADIQNIKQGVLGTLSLGINGTINHLYGAQLLKRYCEANPLTRLKVNRMPSRQIISAVASELVELGLGPFQRNMPDYFATIPLFTDERVLMISRDHPMAGADAADILKKVPLIVSHLDDQDLRPTIDRLRDAFGTISEVSDNELRLSLVADGIGMSYLDQRLINAHPLAEKITPLGQPLDFARIPLTFGLFYRSGREISSGAEQFIELCKSFEF